MILVALAVCAPFWWLVITNPLIALVVYGLAIVVVVVVCGRVLRVDMVHGTEAPLSVRSGASATRLAFS